MNVNNKNIDTNNSLIVYKLCSCFETVGINNIYIIFYVTNSLCAEHAALDYLNNRGCTAFTSAVCYVYRPFSICG